MVRLECIGGQGYRCYWAVDDRLSLRRFDAITAEHELIEISISIYLWTTLVGIAYVVHQVHSAPYFIKISLSNTGAMANLEARKYLSPDSGFPITLHPHFNDKIKKHVPPEPLREAFTPPTDRAFFADPEKKALFSVAKRVDLTESLGTVLENVQLSQLNTTQLDELALLVNERGVVFFRSQDLTTEKQVELFQHYGENIGY